MGDVVSLTTQFVTGGFAGISKVLGGMSGDTARGCRSRETAAGICDGTIAGGGLGETVPVGSLAVIFPAGICGETFPPDIPGETDSAGRSVEAVPVDEAGETTLGISG